MTGEFIDFPEPPTLQEAYRREARREMFADVVALARLFALMIVVIVFVALSACTTTKTPEPGQPAAAAPIAPDPRICADIEVEPPVEGGIVQPATQPERDAVDAFLNGERDVFFWGRRGWTRAELAKTQFCPPTAGTTPP